MVSVQKNFIVDVMVMGTLWEYLRWVYAGGMGIKQW
jgi:hypothetical protein